MVGEILAHIDYLDEAIGRISAEVGRVINPFSEKVALLDTIPGVDRRTAECLIAEIGPDMGRFPTHRHLASWAGLCPGNNESAGKHHSGKTRKGSKWLRPASRSTGRPSEPLQPPKGYQVTLKGVATKGEYNDVSRVAVIGDCWWLDDTRDGLGAGLDRIEEFRRRFSERLGLSLKLEDLLTLPVRRGLRGIRLWHHSCLTWLCGYSP
jgi:hypothetical protein